MAGISEAEHAARRKRVQTLKKAIILLLILAILFPVVLCMILLLKINSLEQRIDELSELVYIKQKSVLTVDMEDTMNNPKSSVGFIMEQEGTADKGNSDEKSVPEEEGYTRKVYLTFDDGPSQYTNEILDILAEYEVKATFFVVGKEDEKSKEALKRITEEGHTLGMHSYSHKYNDIYSSVEAFSEDMIKLQEFLYDITGTWSRVYRFPGGSSNTISKINMREFISYLDEQGIDYFDWNISSKDASSERLSTEQIVKNCIDDLETKDVSVILMHDAAGKRTTVEALPIIIENILAMGDAVMLPITNDTEPIQHITNHEETEE